MYEDWWNLYKTMRTGRHISKTVCLFFCEEEEADQIIEVKVLVPANKPNGNVLIRNKEMSICECDEGYLVLFIK